MHQSLARYLTLALAGVALFACAPAQPTPTPGREPAFTFALAVADVPLGIPDYDRGDWRHWTDADGDCQDTRAEVLIAESRSPATLDGCRVTSGRWWGVYTAATFTSSSEVDVDHLVPLANAHRSGGWAWDAARKEAYANDLNDPDHLIAVSASANRSKGDKGPEEWRPPERSYWCEYAMDWARIKDTWDLAVTAAELAALTDMLSDCADLVALVVTEPSPSDTPPRVGTPDSQASDDRNCVDFATWPEAQAFFMAEGGPAHDRHGLDSDGDGIACAGLSGAP